MTHRSPRLITSFGFVLFVFLSSGTALSQNGTPHPDDTHWDNRFGHPTPEGHTGLPGAIAKNGKFYISTGPILHFHNGYSYYGYSEWDGTGWTHKGPTGGSRIAFDVMYPSGDTLIGGGSFQNLNGTGISYITLWDGSQWDAMGAPLNGRVRALHKLPYGDLIAGGDFSAYGATTTNRLTRWDGSSWSQVTNSDGSFYGTNGAVYSIAGTDTSIIIGGSFTTAGGVTAVNRVVSWNPTTGQFVKLGQGFDSDVFNVTTNGGVIRAGGWFNFSGGSEAKYYAEYGAGSWLGKDYGLTPYPVWRNMYSAPSGDWYTTGAYPFDSKSFGLMHFNGSGWDIVDSLLRGNFWFMTGEGDTLYVSVGTTTDDTRDFRNIGMWDGTRWQGLGSPIGIFYEGSSANQVHAIGYANGVVYASGFFKHAGDIKDEGGLNLVMMTDMGWQKVGGDIRNGPYGGTVYEFGTIGNDLYAGGSFTEIGGVQMNNVGRWDGSMWHSLGEGVTGAVRALTVHGSDVFVAGEFDSAGGQLVNGVARWDGAAWHPLGNGVNKTSQWYPHSIVVNGTDVIVGGQFYSVDSNNVSVESLARWNGSEWSAIPMPENPPPGIRAAFTSLTMMGNDLYTAFNTYSGGENGNVFKWDGESWTKIGEEFEKTVHALWANGNELYAAGNFASVGTDTVWRIAKWNGATWVGLGTGLVYAYNNQESGNALLGTPDGLYVGGSFAQAGMYSSYNFALWKDFAYQAPVLGLSSPVLVSPARYAAGQPVDPTLSWNGVPSATAYRLQVSEDSTFAILFEDSSLTAESAQLSGLVSDTKYFWRVRAENTNGMSWWSSVWSFRTSGTTDVSTVNGSPVEFSLGQNYPNPFNPRTIIEFALPKQAFVEITVFDMLGRRVGQLVGEVLPAGYHKTSFDGERLPSGMYFYQLRAESFVETKKLILVK